MKYLYMNLAEKQVHENQIFPSKTERILPHTGFESHSWLIVGYRSQGARISDLLALTISGIYVKNSYERRNHGLKVGLVAA